MRIREHYCESASCDLRSLRNSGSSHRVLRLPVVLFLPARKMSMERVGQSGLKNLFMITKAAEGQCVLGASVGALNLCGGSLPCVTFIPVIFLVVTLFKYKFIYF